MKSWLRPSGSARVLVNRTQHCACPHLAALLSDWFHQDYALESEDFHQIVLNYKEAVSPEDCAWTTAEVSSFLATFGHSDAAAAGAMQRIFFPCIVVEGWDGLTTTQCLQTVAELLAV